MIRMDKLRQLFEKSHNQVFAAKLCLPFMVIGLIAGVVDLIKLIVEGSIDNIVSMLIMIGFFILFGWLSFRIIKQDLEYKRSIEDDFNEDR